MKVIIAGCRDCWAWDKLLDAIEEAQFDIKTVLCGGASGVDRMGEHFATEMNIPVQYWLADWHTNGKAAGPIRNRKMAENADALIALWDGKSPGTKNMIETARKKGLKVYVKMID